MARIASVQGIGLALLVIATSLIGCDERIGGYTAVSSLNEKVFAKDAQEMRNLQGRVIKFDAPTNLTNLTGLYMKSQSSRDILLTDPKEN